MSPRSTPLTLISFLLFSLILPASANIVYDNTISSSYDFVICGGGLAGLVLAARLSEDSNHTVLVLEAGASGDNVADKINTPDNAYFSSLLGSSYDWAYSTVAQTNAGNRAMSWPRGKVLGGSTAINGEYLGFERLVMPTFADSLNVASKGMYLVRPSDLEVNAWQSLLGNDPNAASWGWDSLLAAMKKVRIPSPPYPELETNYQR